MLVSLIQCLPQGSNCRNNGAEIRDGLHILHCLLQMAKWQLCETPDKSPRRFFSLILCRIPEARQENVRSFISIYQEPKTAFISVKPLQKDTKSLENNSNFTQKHHGCHQCAAKFEVTLNNKMFNDEVKKTNLTVLLYSSPVNT